MVCWHCGALMEEKPTKLVTSFENHNAYDNASSLQAESFIDIELIPEEGIGIHVAGETKPFYVPISGELIIGRRLETDPASEDLLDLTDLHAGSMGVSRHHALIKRTESGYEVIDLLSRNGTWLNAERLVPNKPYPLASGSQLRIGHMRLLIMYRLSST